MGLGASSIEGTKFGSISASIMGVGVIVGVGTVAGVVVGSGASLPSMSDKMSLT